MAEKREDSSNFDDFWTKISAATRPFLKKIFERKRKQTNKPKQREWISDYFTQGAAYCMAHDTIYGTYIDKFVVMMCSADLYYQEFILQGKELKEYKYKWLERLDLYHNRKDK